VSKSRKSVFVISFSTIRGDARVLRQVQYLSPHYDVTVMGYGEPHAAWEDDERVRWVQAVPIFPDATLKGRLKKLANRSLIVGGRLFPDSYDRLYWGQPAFRDALAKALASRADAFHANDWNALPVAAEAARQLKARLVFDAHEYSPVEFEEQFAWRLFAAPMIRHVLRKYAARADATITVAPAIAERYEREFGFRPVVVMNAPRRVSVPPKETDFSRVRLIHHGCAMRDRRIEDTIKVVALCDERYSLHLMLSGGRDPYFDELEALAGAVAPGRVTFHAAVAPEQVVARIAEFDMGFCYMISTNFNYLAALPNKFFECIAAGLPVCVGPSPSMAEIVRKYGLGCVAGSFEPAAFAEALNRLRPDDLAAMRRRSVEAGREINADVEMGKVVRLYGELLGEVSG
jgi:glycosyltransferase involved in cell wall biosynthesis